jgi:hypothetical protein
MNQRQRALSALDSVKQLPDHEREALMKTRGAVNKRILSRNMLAYFEGAVLSDTGVPAFTLDEFTDSLADALIKLGQKHHLGVAITQTLIIELQDRVNQNLK